MNHPRQRPALSTIEPLESRIAPAVILAFTDNVDQDQVKLISNKALTATVTYAPNGSPAAIVLSGAGLDGANVTTVVTRSATGDGLVNIGGIFAQGLDLGAVTVSGDLGKIVCGNAGSPLPGLKSLKARSMGLFGTVTQGGGDLYSEVTGDAGSIAIARDVVGANWNITGSAKSIQIGGDLRGTADGYSGRLMANSFGTVRIGGDLVAGAGDESAKIAATKNLGKLTIGGSMIGAIDLSPDPNTAQIFVGGDAGPIFIGRDLVGAVSEERAIAILGKAGAITVGGSILGGAGKHSGSIVLSGDAGAIKIGRDLHGGDGEFSASILVTGKVGGFSVGRDVRGGSGKYMNGPTIMQVAFASSTGPVKIGGAVVGGTGIGSAVLNLGTGAPSLTVGGSIIGGGAPLAPGFSGVGAGAISTGNTPSVTIGGSLSGGQYNGGNLILISCTKLTIKGSLVGSNVIDVNTIGDALLRVTGNLGTGFIGGSVIGPGAGSFGSSTIEIKGSLGTLQIAGSLVGGAGVSSGEISVFGDAKAIKVGASLDAGTGFRSGNIKVGGRLSTVQIGGSVETTVTASSLGAVKIGGDVFGGLAALTTGFDAITVGGSLYANSSQTTITAKTTLGAVKIGGSLFGASSGANGILFARQAGNIAVGGAIVANGANAPILSFGGGVGAITVGGDVRGPVGGNSLLLFGTSNLTTQGFASLFVKGSVANVFIASGLNPNLFNATNPNSTVGPVTVLGNWTASTLSAGIARGADMLAGTIDDGPVPAAKLARIAAITIGGQVFGSAAAGDHFGFIACNIGPVKIGGVTYQPGAVPIELSPISGDVTIRVV
jgi:hypothetical protein